MLVDSGKVRASTAGWGVGGWNQEYRILMQKCDVGRRAFDAEVGMFAPESICPNPTEPSAQDEDKAMKRKTPAKKPKSTRAVTKNTARPPAGSRGKGVYRIKITLKNFRPRIWRRIEVVDCTLDKLHEHIQTAMGWTNSHLHQFKSGEQWFGDPELIGEDFEEFGFKNSLRTRLSDIVPESGRGVRLDYEYDFGDSWHHDILFEGIKPREPGVKYPRCVAGEGACPPEDCGGVWGYADFVRIMANPRNKRHEEMEEWYGGPFDPEKFDVEEATERMQEGLPDWRRMA
jgi:hypothetical protein